MKFPIHIHESPNFNARPFGTVIDTIVLHYTGMKNYDVALERLCDNSAQAKMRGRVSAHYLIGEDGKIVALVDEIDRAWHAGESYFRGRTNVNDFSIGIELVNPGHEIEYKSFPKPQMDALVALCKSICARHSIKQEFVLAHSDIAPGRKIDPGEKFNWRFLAQNGIGYWPDAEEVDYPRMQYYLASESSLRAAFVKYGYHPDLPTDVMCKAFNLHFGNVDSNVLTWEVAASLSWLNRKILKVPD